MNTVIPSIQDIQNSWQEETDDFVQVHEKADLSWRHGCYMTTVFHRTADDTYWAADYQKSGDGEIHGLREGEFSITQVVPKIVSITKYINKSIEEKAS